MSSACKLQLLAGNGRGWQYFEANTRKCDADGCEYFLPEGRYSANAPFHTCSAECYYTCRTAGRAPRLCACNCGQEVRRFKLGGSDTPVFVSREHWSSYRIKRHLSATVGAFRPIVDEYFDGFAATHYRSSLSYARSALAPFFKFLNEQGMFSLASVTPKVITQYIAWSKAAGRADTKMSYISTFFGWAVEMGHREQASPVIPFIHCQRRRKGEPRPYSSKEMQYIWRLLDERGNARVRFVVAIAEEAGLRLEEICRLQHQDIDPIAQRCFVRLPNKTNTERFACFGQRAKDCFEAWMEERDPKCGHDALLYNTLKKPCSPQMLRAEMNRILCKGYLGRQLNEIGLDRWSVHRLRHTMATNLVNGGAEIRTVMANGGWKSYDAVCMYAAPDLEIARRGYHETMRRVQAKKQASRTIRILSPAELLTRKSKRLVKLYLKEVQGAGMTGEESGDRA